MNVVVVGATSWGATLAILLVRNGISPILLVRSEEEASQIASERRLRDKLLKLRLPEEVQVRASLDFLRGADVVFLCVPSQTMRGNIGRLKPDLSSDVIIVSGAKGLEVGSGLRMSQVILSVLGSNSENRVCALSGPNLAYEIVAGKPAATVVAGLDLDTVERVKGLFGKSPHLRVYTSSDLAGVELAGSLKNIAALGAGMCDGLLYGNNAKAAFLTRALVETARLGVSMGADPLTFAGLAGMGDLLATCYSQHSRNRFTGENLAHGLSLAEITFTLGQVVEGVTTTAVARRLARERNVEMPIVDQVYQVLYNDKPIPEAVAALLQREPKQEW